MGVVLAYALGGLVTGARAGLLSPLARSGVRALAVGAVCSAPTFAVFTVGLGEPLFSQGGAAVATVRSVTIGGVCGVIVGEVCGVGEPTDSSE
jgi:hypothetical protein